MRRLLVIVVLLMSGRVALAADLPPLSEGLWEIKGRIGVTACVGSRCASQSQRVDYSFVVTTDEGSGGPPVVPVCPDVAAPDIVGLATWEPARNGWFRLRVLDRRSLVRFLRSCTGYRSLQLQQLAARIRVQPDGQAFELRETVRLTVVVRGQFARATGVARLRGVRVSEAGGAAPQSAPESGGRTALDLAIDAVVRNR
jgi:hypothetical protein